MQTKATYRFSEFIRPDVFWPYPYTLEQAFGVFRWMIQVGKGYCDRGQLGRQTVDCLLSCKPTCVNFSEIEPITSVADLRKRFHYALLSRHVGPSLRQWRQDNRITPDGQRIIAFPHSAYRTAETSEHQFETAVDALFAAEGRLGVQLNSYHSRAREICRIELNCRQTYRFVLKYGYGGSEWSHTLATQTPSMTFRQTVARASRELQRLIDGKAETAAA